LLATIFKKQEFIVRLQDKVIIVTGSTTGIGEAIAKRFLHEGARVLIHGRDRDRAAAIANEFPGRTAFHIDSLEDPTSAPRIVDAAVSAFGQLDGLVNNAAWVMRSDIYNTDAATFDKVMATNVRAPMLLIQAALPHLKKSKGAVLNIGSMNAYSGEGNLLAYSVSKGALMTLTRNLADYLGPDQVRVFQFNVGWVLTTNEYEYKLEDGLPKDWPENIDPMFAPSGRLIRPEEIAAAAVYWISEESRPISGSVIDLEQYPNIGRNPTKRGEEDD
jgi:NAD(P)-dependent dehydrogenase (short-subunit alcohol dehydrogenase family)